MNLSKHALKLDLYDTYSISQEYSAYTYEYLNVTDTEADSLEAQLESQGYKIFHSNLTRTTSGQFKLEVIVAKMSFLF